MGEPYSSSARDYEHQATAFVKSTTRKQSQILISDTDPDHSLSYPATAKLKIQVQQSIEMNSMQADDADSSRGLMGRVGTGGSGPGAAVPGTFSSSVGHNVTRIHGGARRDSDSYSPV